MSVTVIEGRRIPLLSSRFVILCLASGFLLGCGNAGTDTDLGPPRSDLAEAAADLPRPAIDFSPANSSNPAPQQSESESPANAEPPRANNSTALIMRRFLWKPVSESDGNLAVLVDPENVRIEVDGLISETLRDTGPSNGRGTTARASHEGCDFGDNVQVSFFIGNRRIGFVDGRSVVVIRDGCDRFEFDL